MSRTPAQHRVGLVGAGNIAQVAQLPALASRDGVVLAGLVTNTTASAEANLRRWPIEKAYPSVEQMINHARLDSLFVLTPRSRHFLDVSLGLRAGLDVFSEKPLADSAAGARELAALADETKRMLFVNFNRRHASVYRMAHEQLPKGPPRIVVAQKHRRGSEYRATFENAIHMVDLLRWYCGEPIDVTAHALPGGNDFEDGVVAVARFDTGSIGTLVAARNAGRWEERLDAHCGEVSVHVQAPERFVLDSSAGTSSFDAVPAAFGWASATDTFGFAAAVHEFLRSTETRAATITDGWSAYRTQVFLEQILAAAGLAVEDDPQVSWQSHAVR